MLALVERRISRGVGVEWPANASPRTLHPSIRKFSTDSDSEWLAVLRRFSSLRYLTESAAGKHRTGSRFDQSLLVIASTKAQDGRAPPSGPT